MRITSFTRAGWMGAGVLLLAACGGGAQTVAPASSLASPAKPAASASVAPASSGKPAASTSGSPVASGKPAAGASASGAAAPSGPPVKVAVAYTSTDVQHLPIQIALDQKLFEKYGLDVQINNMDSGTEMSKVLIGGKLNFVSSNLTEVADAHAAGEDERIIANPYDIPTDGLFVGPGIKTKDDLKGKKVGISRFGTASELTARLLVRKVGLDDTKDVTIVQVGGESARIKAAIAGTVDAVPADSTGKRGLEKQGLRMMDTLADPNGQGGNSHGLIAMASYTKQNAEATRRAVMAYGEGVWILKNKPDIAAVSISKMLGRNEQDEIGDVQKLFSSIQRIPPVSEEAKIVYSLKLLEAQDARASKQKPADLYDNSFVESLAKAGFFEQLGR